MQSWNNYNTKCDKQTVSEHIQNQADQNGLTNIPRKTIDETSIIYEPWQKMQSNQDLGFQIHHQNGAALTRWKEQASKSFYIVTL